MSLLNSYEEFLPTKVMYFPLHTNIYWNNYKLFSFKAKNTGLSSY